MTHAPLHVGLPDQAQVEALYHAANVQSPWCGGVQATPAHTGEPPPSLQGPAHPGTRTLSPSPSQTALLGWPASSPNTVSCGIL